MLQKFAMGLVGGEGVKFTVWKVGIVMCLETTQDSGQNTGCHMPSPVSHTVGLPALALGGADHPQEPQGSLVAPPAATS